MVFNVHQLMVLRSLLKVGSPAELINIFCSRCDCTEQDWQQLVEARLVEQDDNSRWWLSAAGRRAYRQQSKGKYF